MAELARVWDTGTKRFGFVDTAGFGGAHGNHTGDVTSVGLVTTIANDAVTNAKLADSAAWTLKGRPAAGSGDPSDFLISSLAEQTTPAAGDFLLGQTAGGELRKFDVGDLPSGGGGGAVDSVTGSNGISVSPTTGAVVVSGINLLDLAGTRTMTGALNMGTNAISGVTSITATGKVGDSSGILDVGNRIVFADRSANHSIDSWANTIIRLNAGGSAQTLDVYSTGLEAWLGNGSRSFTATTGFQDFVLYNQKGVQIVEGNGNTNYRGSVSRGFTVSNADGSMSFGTQGGVSASWLWNAYNAGDRYLLTGETATRLYQDSTGYEGTSTPGFAVQWADGTGKTSGDAITWTTVLACYSDRTTTQGFTVYANGRRNHALIDISTDPTTTELPNDGDHGNFHNTTSGNRWYAVNDGGTIYKTQLT